MSSGPHCNRVSDPSRTESKGTSTTEAPVEARSLLNFQSSAGVQAIRVRHLGMSPSIGINDGFDGNQRGRLSWPHPCTLFSTSDDSAGGTLTYKPVSFVVIFILALAVSAQSPPAVPSWIAVSNNYTNMVLAVEMKHHPESGSRQGLSQFDTKVSQPT